MSKAAAVRVSMEKVVIPTYLPAAPDVYPMFLEKRVYQGSSGRVYPLPFTDRISETKRDRKWQAVWLENEYLRVMVLPEIGGRIHVVQDKTNGYDLVYRQEVIKPALVGLAGPWISGGIEFNWPQHHRPATFLPVDFDVEEHADGSKTVWCSDHDPMARMKGMHGVCLHPGKAYLEMKVRAYNRTPLVQTFLWWANVATRVHEAYQSFFPPDVQFVADHAKRAVSEYPLCRGHYYGVNYGERGRQGTPRGECPSNFVPRHCGGQAPVDYAPNDLSFYANIPVPTSYMCLGTKEDFFGGYDHLRQAGLVHVANHHIAPGKKQWTWGNHGFGYAWDRNLTDADGEGEFAPYIELMAGVYTDNQPDFSFLQPGETKTWSQYWFPIQKIGPAQHANLDAAVHLEITAKKVRLGVSVSSEFRGAKVRLEGARGAALGWKADLKPGEPFVTECAPSPKRWPACGVTVRVLAADGREIIAYQPKPRVKGEAPPPATEPAAPEEIASADELYVTGLHLEQYRHATRCPTSYWREALRRDPLDARSNNAMGLWHLRRGEFGQAEKCFRKAIQRLTRRNPNPYDGEPYYNLGLCLRYQLDAKPKWEEGEQASACKSGSPSPWPSPHGMGRGDAAYPSSGSPSPWPSAHGMGRGKRERLSPLGGERGRAEGRGSCVGAAQLFEDAYSAFYKATWNQAWAAAAYHALAEMDCRRGDWATALDHLNRSLRFNSDNLRARDLKALVVRRLGRAAEADALVAETLALDPLDWWARHLAGQRVTCDLQACLDVAHDYARAGFPGEAIDLLKRAKSRTRDLPDQSLGAAPLVSYTLGWLCEQIGDRRGARAHYGDGAKASPDYCFPARLEEIAVLQAAMRANPRDGRAPYYLGNLLYDRRRHEEAIRMWERSAKLNPADAVTWRNLGIGYFNVLKRPTQARTAYERAFRLARSDARLLFERDQLWKRLGEMPQKRLRELEKHLGLVRERDDLSVELCALYNQIGRHEQALGLIGSRHFQPWEGGEGQALGQHVRTRLALGRLALGRGDAVRAREHFEAARSAPRNLGEAQHLLANQSDIEFWIGEACDALGDPRAAREHWHAAATFRGDFREMSVRLFSEMTYYSARALERLGRKAAAKNLLKQLLAYARKLRKTRAKIDYFATSLPTMLLFEDDIQRRQEMTALFLEAQAHLGLGHRAQGRALLAAVLRRDPNQALAADFLASR